MRQVPLADNPLFSCYGLVGAGRLARHIAHYLHLLQIPFVTWSRQMSASPVETLQNCSHILILITDSQIEPFIKAHPKIGSGRFLTHCSGALFTPLAVGVHPLMTFHQRLYDKDTYQKIHFVMDSQKHAFSSLLPGFPNTHSFIHSSQKAKYHALCVMAGNFSTLLWQVFFKQMQNDFGISKSQALVYLQQTFDNIACLDESLTGPLARRDQTTIDLNLKALRDDPLLYDIYQTFLKLGGKT